MKNKIIGPFIKDYFFLSNFYIIDIEYNGHVYKSSEHAYQAAKATNEKDLLYVKESETPSISKRRGQNIKIRPDWNDIKLDVMKEICTIKFNIPELKQKLIDTGDKTLIELNNWNDKFWGADIDTHIGHNHLGQILMEIRDNFRPKSNSLGNLLNKIFKPGL